MLVIPPISRKSPTKNHNATITILLIFIPPTKRVAARNFHEGEVQRISYQTRIWVILLIKICSIFSI